METILQALLLRQGHYRGRGVNHQAEPFIGEMHLEEVLGGRGLIVRYRALSESRERVFYQEYSVLAPSTEGLLVLSSLSDQSPGLIPLALRREEQGPDLRRAVFGYGRPTDEEKLRLELTLELKPERALGYRFAWGMPGEPLELRSSVTLEPQPAPPAKAW